MHTRKHGAVPRRQRGGGPGPSPAPRAGIGLLPGPGRAILMGMARLSLRIDLAPDRRIGPGKIALLEAIEATGSISAAGRALGMSYRRAWLLVEDLNRALGEPVVAAQVGGSHGGGTCLTERGRELVSCYRALERAVQAVAAEHLAALPCRMGTPPEREG